MNSIIKKLKTIRMEIILLGLALFALGLFLVVAPKTSQEVICRAIGVALCIWGVLRLGSYFKNLSDEILESFGLVQGVSLVAFGFFIVVRPGFIAAFLGTALGIVIVIDGILKLQYAIDFYQLKNEKWWVDLLGAALMIGVGAVALFNPFKTADALTIFLGICLMVEGIWDIVAIIRITAFAKKVGKEIKDFNDKMTSIKMD